jgi:hypothetical protein
MKQWVARFWKNVRISDIVSAAAVLISLAALYVTIMQQLYLRTVQKDSLYFGSYRIGENLRDIAYKVRDPKLEQPEEFMKQQVHKRVEPIEESIGVDSALDAITLGELEEEPSLQSDWQSSLYTDATNAKFDNPAVGYAFLLGHYVADLNYAAGLQSPNPKLLAQFWQQVVPNLNVQLKGTKLPCDALPASSPSPAPPSLPPNAVADFGILKGCIHDSWLRIKLSP